MTDLVHRGVNALGAMLSDGWWRGQHGIVRATNAYGTTTALLAELHVTLTSGETVVVGTDDTWRSTPSHVLAADLIAGEDHDLRRRVPGWADPGTDRSTWTPVTVADHPFDTLVAPQGPPTRQIEELAAVSVTELAPGRHVVDFGQNSNGWIRLTDLGPEGTELRIAYGEWLDADGDVTQEHIAACGVRGASRGAAAVPGRRGDLGGRRVGVRASPLDQGLPVRAHRGPPRPTRPCSGDERGGALRPHPDRRVRVLE